MFNSFALSAVAFVVALGILIAIHEFGHFWVARRVGVKVLRFSVGFGRPIWQRKGRVDGTEYVIAAIPLGGYVRMLDEREAPVASAELERAFNRQSLGARAAVVAAGPFANFVLAILAYWLVLMIGISGTAPLLAEPPADSAAAQAGFSYGDRIVAVAGEPVETWTDARIALVDAALDTDGAVAISVETAAGETRLRELALQGSDVLQADGDAFANLGFLAWYPDVEARIDQVVDDSPADRAGLRPGDLVLAVDGTPIDDFRGFVEAVQPRPGERLEITVSRDDGSFDTEVVPEPVTLGDTVIGRIGVSETRSRALAERARVTVSRGPIEAIGGAVERTWDMSILTLRMLGKLVVGQASLDNISGPISIAQFAGQSASVGIDHYINFIALISISLAVLNLLPIPMLDGGHLLYFAIEALRGRPLSESVQMHAQHVGILLLGGLMGLAFYNDLVRLVQ